ncbi:MAG: hypothetical protein HY744_12585, partial [Deltaproteobacteria bacterium]|nr:hypothetical protein [Deltaproteobacteria bacterium]
VQVFDEAGQFLFKLGEHGTGPGKFEYPVGIGIDAWGYAYVADASNGVQKFNPSGRYVTELPMAAYAYGVAVNRATGTIYVGLRDRISMFRPLARSAVDPATGLEARATGDVVDVQLTMSQPQAMVTAGAEGGEVAVRFILWAPELDRALCPSWCTIAENGVGLPTSRVEGSIIYFARTRFAPGETKTFTLTTDVTLCHFPPGNPGNFHTLVVESWQLPHAGGRTGRGRGAPEPAWRPALPALPGGDPR